jgi:hypothetical protein
MKKMSYNFIPGCFKCEMGPDGFEIVEKSSHENYVILKDLYNFCKNLDFDSFVELFEKFMNDSKMVSYFSDFGGTPASNYFKLVNYELCSCKTEWVYVHRSFSERECNCANGKRLNVYNLAKQALEDSDSNIFYNLDNLKKAKRITKYIRESGPINIYYKCWQKQLDLDE